MKMVQRLFIEGPLPGLNTLIAAAKRFGEQIGRKGRRYNHYAAIKKEWGERIALIAKTQGIKPLQKKTFFVFFWYEPNRRRDPDNIAAGGRKIIFDALVHAGILPDDKWNYVAGWDDRFDLANGGRPGVLIIMKEMENGASSKN